MISDSELNDKIKIIDTTPEMWRTYKKIRLRGLKEDPQSFGSLYEKESEFPDDRWVERAENPYCTLALIDDTPVGTMSAFTSKDNNITVVTIVGAFVAKEARRRKIGSRLIERVLEKIDQTPNIDIVRLEVGKAQFAAIQLYQKFGFKKVSEQIDHREDGTELNEFIMERSV